MPRLNIIPTGGLNKDDDLNSLPSGDYSSARNIVTSAGKSGGANTIKILESIKDSGISAITGTFKAAHVDPDGNIYALYRTDSTNAAIYLIPSTIDSKTIVITYAHGASTDFTPDIRKIGDILVWNYYGSGSLLYWNTTRSNGATPTFADLTLAKSPPIGVLGITKTITLGLGVQSLEDNDVQFSARYKYDTGEYSVLSEFTELFKAEDDTASYTIAFTLTDVPTYASEIDVYVRFGNSGTWRRIYTGDVSGGSLSSLTWKGEIFETLDSLSGNLSFSAVPSNAKSIEVINNRVWVANFADDYQNDAAGTLTITANTGYSLATGGSIVNYIGDDTTDAAIKSTESGTYYKPFPNNSSYSVGVAFFDENLKTRGVEYFTTFKTGKFANPIAPTFSISETGDAKPSWAQYMQLVISKNLSKSSYFEGYASSIYFIMEVNGEEQLKLSLVNEDLQNLKYLVLDISGMYKAGEIYSYQVGDRVLASIPNATATTTDADGSQTGAYRLLDMEVKGSNGDLIYCEWNGGECLNDAIPDPESLYFEIYSPKQQQDEENVLLYGVGRLIDISSSIPTTITNYHIGDSVFDKIEFPKYTDKLLYKTKQRSIPADITANAITEIKSTKLTGDNNTLGTLFSIYSNQTKTENVVIEFDTTGVYNQDGILLNDGTAKIQGFYDSSISASADFDLQIVRVINSNNNNDTVDFKINAYVQRTPYDIESNTYGEPILVGVKKEVYSSSSTASSLSDSSQTLSAISINFNLSSNNPNVQKTSNSVGADNLVFSYGDKIAVVFELSLTCSSLNVGQASLAIKEKIGITETCVLTIVGDRIAPVDKYLKRTTVDTAASNTAFMVRKMSNNSQLEWSGSFGKPYLKAKDNFTARRSNAFRHSGVYVDGTDVNPISIFNPLDTHETPRESGDIMSLQSASRIQGEGNMLMALCKNECYYILLGEVRATQSTNTQFNALSSNIVGTIKGLGKRTGIQNKSDVYNYNGSIYWWDNDRKIISRYTRDGLIFLSDIKMRSHFLAQSGSAIFAYDPYYSMVLTKISTNDCISFDEQSGRWRSEYDIDFEGAIHYGNLAIYFDGGKIYKSLENASGNRVGEYFGAAYDGSITMTTNTIVPVSPTYIRVDHNMNVIDNDQSNKVKTSLLTIDITNENNQETNIVEGNWSIEDNKLYAWVQRDVNSAGGIVNGYMMRGYNNNFELTLKDNTQENRIFAIDIEFQKVSGH